MRAAEFIQKLVKIVDAMDKQTSAAPPQQIVININGGTASVTDTNAIKPSGEPVKDPADRKGSDGKVKWTPPLQQHLDTVKADVAANQSDATTMSSNPAIPGQ